MTSTRAGALGTLLGRDLARLGVSVNFAPVADCALEAENNVIGTRAYGSDPLLVARFAGAFARGLEAGGVAAALKHFPGHGSTAVDSHLALPRVTLDETIVSGPRPGAVRSRDHRRSRADRDGRTRRRRGVRSRASGLALAAHSHRTAARRTRFRRRDLYGLFADGRDRARAGHRRRCGRRAGRRRRSADREPLARTRSAQPPARLPRPSTRARCPANGWSKLRSASARCASATPCCVRTAETLDANLPLAVAQRAVTVLRGTLRLRDARPVTVISFEGDAFDGAGGVRRERPSLSTALRARRWKSEVMRVALDPDAGDLDLLLGHLPSLGDRNFVITTRRAHLYPEPARGGRAHPERDSGRGDRIGGGTVRRTLVAGGVDASHAFTATTRSRSRRVPTSCRAALRRAGRFR